MKKNSKKNIKLEYSKPLLVFLIIIIIAFIVTYMVNKKSVEDYKSIKTDSSKYYVYTYKENRQSKSYIPQINIFSEDAQKVNKKIIEESKVYLNSNTPDTSVSYQYNQHKNILSIVLTYKNLNEKKELQFSFKTFVFDLKDDGRLLSSEEILSKYDITTIGVDNIIKKKMKSIYIDEVEKGFIKQSECDFNCYLKLRGTTDFSQNANYYIENGHLVVYRAFNVYSKYKEEEYFTRDNFKFIIK